MCFLLSKEFPFLFHKLQEIYETKFILPCWEIVRFRMETRLHVAFKRTTILRVSSSTPLIHS